MPITVNADDFGKSNEINRAILEAFEKGLISRTTLMANMPAAEEAMQEAKARGLLNKVGVHLNLTTGKPLTSEMASDKLFCDENGEYTADFARSLKTRFFIGKESKNHVINELDAQIKEYERLGGKLFHIDSHHHVHTDLSVWRPLMKVLRKWQVKSVRLSRNMYRGGNKLFRIYKLMLNHSIRRFNDKEADFFGSMEDFNCYISSMTASEKDEFIKNHNIEIMVHPMYSADGQLMDEDVPLVGVLC